MIPVLYLHHRAEVSGGETSLLLLWEGLDRRAFSPLLAGPAEGPLADRARHLGVPVYPLPFPRLRRLVGPELFRTVWRLRGLIRRTGARILHGNAPVTNLPAALAGRLNGPRVVWHERTLCLPHEWDVDALLRGLPHRIICNSAAVARRFGGPGERVVIIYNGVPLHGFFPGCGGGALRRELGLAPDQILVGIVGNFSPLKRHEVFLGAAARLASAPERVRFLVVGGEVFRENHGREAALRAEASRLGLGERVRFLGVRQDMPSVMDALDILVAPCEVEACSRAILEAMGTGTAALVPDAGGNPELVAHGESGLLLPPGDAGALTAALARLIDDAPLRDAMGRAARARAVERFGIEQQVTGTERVYRALLEAPRTRLDATPAREGTGTGPAGGAPGDRPFAGGADAPAGGKPSAPEAPAVRPAPSGRGGLAEGPHG